MLHSDSIEWADQMEAWRVENKDLSKPGDDRTPPWRWIGSLYYSDGDNSLISMPADNVMKSVMSGATEVPTGKGKKTFKTQSQSGITCKDFYWPLLVNGKTIPMSAILPLQKVEKFSEQEKRVRDLGFTLFVKRVRVGEMKHVRVRPRFDNWSIEGDLILTDSQISDEILRKILQYSGTKGLGDGRPSSPRAPGSFGMFQPEF
jgi:hypothetical protein